MADSHCYHSNVSSWSEPYDTQLQSTPQQKLWGYPNVEYPIANIYQADPTADNHSSMNLTARSYNAPHREKLWSYPYVEYPKANTYELDPKADGHTVAIRLSSVWSWSEPYGNKLHSTPQQNAMGLSIYMCLECHIANTYELSLWQIAIAIRLSSVWSWSEPYGTELRSTPQQ